MLARIVDMAAVGMVVADLEGRLVYANRAFGELLERPIDGATILDLVHGEDAGAAALQLQRLMRGEAGEYRGEHRFAKADGSPIWVMLACSVLPSDTTGKPDYLIVQLHSIELQKRAELALSHAESRWNFALEGARQGVWDHDGRTDTMYYSTMWRTLRGFPPDYPVPKEHEATWMARIHPEDRQRVADNIKKLDQGVEGCDEIEYREQHADGSYVWILARGKPVEWENGQAIRTIGTDTDITRLKTTEMELAAEKERLRITLASIADGMIAADALGRITFINSAAEQLTGVASARAIGRDVQDVFVLRDAISGARQPCPVGICLAKDRIAHLDDDMVLIAQDGSERDIRCTAAPLRTAEAGLTGAVLVFQDVTQSRAMQRQLSHVASHDDLTGLPNRAAFDRALGTAMASVRDGQRRHCLLYLDLDRFKPVNDTAGHAAGDALLKQVAETLRGTCRSHDVTARIGGDEFAVILHDTTLAAGKQMAARMVRAIASLDFGWAGRNYRIGASIGLTVVDAHPASPLGFMGEADAACYAAKARGRGTVVAFGEF